MKYMLNTQTYKGWEIFEYPINGGIVYEAKKDGTVIANSDFEKLKKILDERFEYELDFLLYPRYNN